ncbi:MAG: hypothetical protein MJ061_06625 [Mailhella sp.]|nr:hypothetical protein [Mailhella sp.]
MPAENDVWFEDFLSSTGDDGNLFPVPEYPTFRYDAHDYMIVGGSGIDCIVNDGSLSLADLLNQDSKVEGVPLVIDVEMLITGEGAESITDITKVEGLTLESTESADIIRLGSSWVLQDDAPGDAEFLTFAHDGGLRMQLHAPAFAQVDIESEGAVFMLQVGQA